MRTLAGIIKTRTVTILEQVDYEIKQSHLDKHLIAGIVLTGGGAQLRHIKELTEFTTGIDTRIGLPNEHLEKNSDPELTNTMYATGIGLVLYGLEKEEELTRRADGEESEPVAEEPEASVFPPVFDQIPSLPDDSVFARYDEAEQTQNVEPKEEKKEKTEKSAEKKNKRSKGFGKGFTNAIEAYFNKVFNDSTIKNEGEE